MKSINSINFEIGFSDSQIISYQSNPQGLWIFLEAWNGKILLFEFFEVIFFSNLDSWLISDVVEANNSDNLKIAIKILYSQTLPENTYRVIQFLDLSENVAIEVCCKNFHVSIYYESSNFCRVCGLYQVNPPWGTDGLSPTFEFCNCCGVRFGKGDRTPEEVRELRENWMDHGYLWAEKVFQPKNWKIETQLKTIPRAFF